MPQNRTYTGSGPVGFAAGAETGDGAARPVLSGAEQDFCSGAASGQSSLRTLDRRSSTANGFIIYSSAPAVIACALSVAKGFDEAIRIFTPLTPAGPLRRSHSS